MSNDAEFVRSRLIAALIDLAVAVTVIFLFSAIGIISASITDRLSSLQWGLFFGFTVLIVFFCLRDNLFHHNSIGKHLMKIKVVSVEGGQITLLQSMQRNIISVAVTFILWVGVLLNIAASEGSAFSLVVGSFQLLAFLTSSLVILWELIQITANRVSFKYGDKVAGTQVVHRSSL